MTRKAVSTQHLNVLMQAAICDAGAEDAFFHGLLNATVYAHVPIKTPPAGSMRFIQFNRPDNGELVLPFFSDRRNAEFAARGNVGIIAMDGRSFLELTLGASLMLNPNDEWLMLYPPEVSTILAGEPLARITKEVIEEDEEVSVLRPSISIDDLASVLAKQLSPEPDAEAAYVVEIHRGEDQTDASILITVIAPKKSETRIVQMCGHAIKQQCPSFSMPVLISVEHKADAAIIEHAIQVHLRA